MKTSYETLAWTCQRLGLDPKTLPCAPGSVDEVRKRFRQTALELHPDRTGNDPQKTEEFKRLSEGVQALEEVLARPPPSPRAFPPGIRISIIYSRPPGQGPSFKTSVPFTNFVWNP